MEQQTMLDAKNIILHTTSSCPRCKVLKEKLDIADIKYEENYDVEKMFSIGIQSVPVLEVKGELMDFSKAVKWIGGLT